MKRCKVYYSLLAICYLEVLLWTTCLLSSCATLSARVEDTGYLQRETCNLKQTIGAFDNQQLLPGFLDLRGGDLHTQEELLSLQRLKESVVTPALSQRPVITLASLLPVGKGVPAPYSGVKAIVKQLQLVESSGAGIAIGTYFAFYGAASNMLSTSTTLAPGQIAFVAGGMAAAGGSVVKVPLAVCIRSVQAGVYPNVFKAAGAITEAAGVRGLFTGYLPTLLEDVPDMAFKFAAYETLRQVHRRLNDGRKANVQEDFAMGACAGAFAAAATTPLDVIKTNMMCTAASRPTMMSASRAVLAQGGPKYFFRGVGARALSNGINSAVFFCFFEALRATFAKKKEQALRRAVTASRSRTGRPMLSTRQQAGLGVDVKFGKTLQPATASLSFATGPALELS
ncbi:hypothetical protein WJX79_009580 [Trebouxia sp. C0005]